jgi:hypothetical protein
MDIVKDEVVVANPWREEVKMDGANWRSPDSAGSGTQQSSPNFGYHLDGLATTPPSENDSESSPRKLTLEEFVRLLDAKGTKPLDAALRSFLDSRKSTAERTSKAPLLTVFGGNWNNRTLQADDATHGQHTTATPNQRLEAYRNYVREYKRYIKDRKSTDNAKSHEDALHLLDVVKAI